jgi:arsenate reductase
MTETVLFACIHNAGRSQIAAAFLRSLVDARDVRVDSGGTQPGERVHPEVVAVMREVGLELSDERPRPVNRDPRYSPDLLVTMGCGEGCDFVPARAREDWPLADPKGRDAAAVRAIRDEIKTRVEDLARRRGWLRSAVADRATARRGP